MRRRYSALSQAGSSVENGARSTYKGLVTSQERKLSLARPNPTCMVAHQRHRKKCFRMVKFFKVRVFIFIFFQNIICYFEFFYEKIYKKKKYIRIQKDLKKKITHGPATP